MLWCVTAAQPVTVSLSACSLPSVLQWELVIKHSNQSYVWSKVIVFLCLFAFLSCFFILWNDGGILPPPEMHAQTLLFFQQCCQNGGLSPQFYLCGLPVLAARWPGWWAFIVSPVLLRCSSASWMWATTMLQSACACPKCRHKVYADAAVSASPGSGSASCHGRWRPRCPDPPGPGSSSAPCFQAGASGHKGIGQIGQKSLIR